MPTKDQVLARYATVGDYRQVGDALGIPPGLAYMIATGMPAGGGDAFTAEELDRPGVLPASTQHLIHGHMALESPTTKEHVHDWVRDQAAGDLPMQRAAAGRDAAPGEVRAPEETDITSVLTREHNQVVALMKQLKAIPGATSGGSSTQCARRKSIADMVSAALSGHEAAEQEELWPAVRELFPHGSSVVERALSQEQEGKDLLHQLGRAEASDPRFDELVTKLDTAARAHVALEDQVLMTLRETVPRDVRRRMGRAFLDARAHAPTSLDAAQPQDTEHEQKEPG